MNPEDHTRSGTAGAARAGSRWFLLVVAAFIASLLTSNIIAVRIVYPRRGAAAWRT